MSPHPVCFHSGPPVSPSLTWGTNKELALPTPPCSSPPPKVLVPSFLCSQTTSGQLCCFLFVSFLDICHCCCYQRQMFILTASCSAHTPLQDALGKGPGAKEAGNRPPQSQGRWGSAPRMLQQSEQGACVDGRECRATFSPCSAGEEVAIICPSLGPPPLVSYLQLLE